MAKKHDKPIAKTTVGKGRHYLKASEGAGMTEAGRRFGLCFKNRHFKYGEFTKSGNQYVYYHTTTDTGEVFYVGIGRYNRCNQVNQRNKYWKSVVNKHGIIVNIFTQNISILTAKEIEVDLIKLWSPKCNMTPGGDFPSILNKKPVFAYNLNGLFFMEFNSISEANIFFNKKTNDSRINQCIKEQRKSFCNYMWKDYKSIEIAPYKKFPIYNLRPVHRYDFNGNYLESYSKISDFKEGSRTGISNCLDKNSTCMNSFWRTYKADKINVPKIKPALKENKKVIDKSTKIIFNSLSDAAKHIGLSRETLRRKLSGIRINNTNMIYYG